MRMVAVLLVFGMLLAAGCTGCQQAALQGGNETTGGEQGGAGGAGGAGGGQAGGSGGGAGGLAGLGFEQLVALGTPVHCIVRMTENGQAITSEMWIKGGSVRAETTAPGTTEKYVTILKGNDVFFQMTPEMKQSFSQMGKTCDWLKISQTESQQGGIEAPSKSDFENIPPMDYSCNPGAFGDEKFATPGSACDYREVFGGMGGQQVPGGGGAVESCLNACAQLPANQQEDCFMACAGQ